MSKRIKILLSAAISLGYLLSSCKSENLSHVSMEIAEPGETISGEIIPEESDPSGGESPEDWEPEIIDLDDPYSPDEYDDSIHYNYSSDDMDFDMAAGSFSKSKGSGLYYDYTSAATNSLAVCNSGVSFPYGTFSCDLKTVSNGDCGIVFALDASSKTFWENSCSYYIFLFSTDGRMYLGKINNGVWTVLQSASYSFNTTTFYTMKVIYKNYKSYCYINDKLLIEYKESKPLKGTRFGIRAGAPNAEFKNLSITNDYLR